MSYDGYNEHGTTVGAGFLSTIQDLGDKRKVGNVITIVPIVIGFVILSAYGVFFGFISFKTAMFYTMVVTTIMAVVSRFETEKNKSKDKV